MSTPLRAHDNPYTGYEWIVSNPGIFAGKPIIKGTRFSVSFILECLSQDMDADEIEKTYGTFPKESIPEVLKFASGLADKKVDNSDVAA